jgi:hypothetical protein
VLILGSYIETLLKYLMYTRCYNPGVRHLQSHRCENLKSYLFSNRQSGRRFHTKLVKIMELRVVNFATPRNLVVTSTMCPQRGIYKYTWTSPDRKTQNQIEQVLINRRWHSSTLDVRSFSGAVILTTVW